MQSFDEFIFGELNSDELIFGEVIFDELVFDGEVSIDVETLEKKFSILDFFLCISGLALGSALQMLFPLPAAATVAPFWKKEVILAAA